MKRSNLWATFLAFLLLTALGAAAVLLHDPSLAPSTLLSSAPAGDRAYSYLLTRAPLAYLNTTGFLILFTGEAGPAAAIFAVLALFTYCLYLGLSEEGTTRPRAFARTVLVAIFLSHPDALWLLTQSPVDVFILCGLFSFSRGLVEINGRSQGRGIILMAIGSTVLFLSGATGIAFTAALLVSAPVFLRSELFRTSIMGGTIILAFPVLAALIGMGYLSWLFGVPMSALAFDRTTDPFVETKALAWVPFLILLLPYLVQLPKLGITGFLERHSSFVIVPLAVLTLFLLKRLPRPEVITGYLALGAGLEFMHRKNVRGKHFILSSAFLAASWALALRSGSSLKLGLPLREIPYLDIARGSILLGGLLILRLYYLQSHPLKNSDRLRYHGMKTLLCLIFAALSSGTFAAPEISVSPLFTYGNYQRFDEVKNLTLSSAAAVETAESSAEGYELLSIRKIYASLGAQAVSGVELASGTFGYVGLGLYPSYNSYAKHFRRFSDRTELRAFTFDVPTRAEDVKKLSPGDAVYWNAQGGLTVNLSFGMSVAGVGPKVSVEGGHSVYVERKSVTEVYVEVRRLSTRSWGLVAGALITYAEAAKLVENSQGHAFLIDVSQPEGSELYEALISRGRADLLQESPAVRAKIGDVSALKVLGSGKFALAVPFVPVLELKREAGTEVLTEERSDIWDRSRTLVRALSFHTRGTRVFRKQTVMETAALVVEETENGVRSSRSQLHWFRKGNRFKLSRIRVALQKLINQTGMSGELATTIPTGDVATGFAKVEFTLALSPELDQLVARRAESPKDRARYLQKFWNGPRSFSELLALVKSCGGSWQLEISGEKIRRLLKKETFEPTSECPASL